MPAVTFVKRMNLPFRSSTDDDTDDDDDWPGDWEPAKRDDD